MLTLAGLLGVKHDARLLVAIERHGLTIEDIVDYFFGGPTAGCPVNIFVKFYPPYVWWEEVYEYDPDMDGADGDRGITVRGIRHEVYRPINHGTWGILEADDVVKILEKECGAVNRLYAHGDITYELPESVSVKLSDLFVNSAQVANLASLLGVDKPVGKALKPVVKLPDGRSCRADIVRQEVRAAVLENLSKNLHEVAKSGSLTKTKLADVVGLDARYPLASEGTTKSYLSRSGKDLAEIYSVANAIIKANPVEPSHRQIKIKHHADRVMRKHLIELQPLVAKALDKYR